MHERQTGWKEDSSIGTKHRRARILQRAKGRVIIPIAARSSVTAVSTLLVTDRNSLRYDLSRAIRVLCLS